MATYFEEVIEWGGRSFRLLFRYGEIMSIRINELACACPWCGGKLEAPVCRCGWWLDPVVAPYVSAGLTDEEIPAFVNHLFSLNLRARDCPEEQDEETGEWACPLAWMSIVSCLDALGIEGDRRDRLVEAWEKTQGDMQ